MTHGDFGSFPRSDCRRYEVQDGLQARRRVRELSYQARTRVQRRNQASLLEDLMEPVARQARKRALAAIQRAKA